MSDLLAALSQMAMSLGFHIIFGMVGIAMPVAAERRWQRTGDRIYLDLARRWAKGTAILPGAIPTRLPLADRFVVAHELQDIAFRISHVQGPPPAPPVLDGGDLRAERPETGQLSVEVTLVDLEPEMMQRCLL